MNRPITRKGFLQGSAAGAAGLIALGMGGAALADEDAKSIYTAGTYSAQAKGIGTVSVEITCDADAITDVVVDTSSETEGIGRPLGDQFANQVLSSQQAQIDSVSGATVTSNAVQAALNDCLAQALLDPSTIVVKSWRDAPDPVADDQIVAEYDADIVVVGLGHAGTPALRMAAETNPSLRVIGIESQPQDSYFSLGHEIGHINSKFLASRGIDPVDPVEFMNNWQVLTHNKSNPSLVSQFAHNCGDIVDWYLEPVSQEIKDTARIKFWPPTEHTMLEFNTGLKYWFGSIEWWTDSWENDGAIINNGSGLEMKNIEWANHDYIINELPNAEIHYATRGEQLVLDDNGAVVGVIAKNPEGNYVKYHAQSVILAGGGFGSNLEMCHDLLPEVVDLVDMGEGATVGGGLMFDRDGSGIRMGLWAGARMEAGPIATMGYDTTGGPGSFTGLWLDENGKRFTNEAFGGGEITGFQMARTKRRKVVNVFDGSVTEMVLYNVPTHGAYDPSPENIAKLQANLDAAYAAGAEGANGYYGADSLEQLADYLGYEGADKEAFLASVEHYNELCEAGVDSDFGKDPRVLFPVKNGPFYAIKKNPQIGSGLVTVGGLLVDGNQQVLDREFRPIPNLYASGNNSGARFGGGAYMTPISGVSIGMAITLGALAGRHCANL